MTKVLQRCTVLIRKVGVFEYSKELEDIIEGRKLLEHGNEMEVEIRAASVQAVEQLAAITGLPAYKIDNLLWDLQTTTNYSHHRTRSIFY